MLKRIFLSLWVLSCLFLNKAYTQSTSTFYIDSSDMSVGVSAFELGDLNMDGRKDIVVTKTGSNGQLGMYLQTAQQSFSPLQVLDSVPFMKKLVLADLDKNGRKDIAAIGGIDQSIFLYLHEPGDSYRKIHLDSLLSIAVNDIVSADFDQNGTLDLVVIGQHSIDLYLNDGNAQFSKSAILTTQSSPKQLECLDLSLADMNKDGWPDLVCAETAGLVVYMNNSDSTFSPRYFSETTEIGVLLHTFDMDGDGDEDVIMENSLGELKVFTNDGEGNLRFREILSFREDVHALASIDHDQDGQMDLMVSYLHQISVLVNDAVNPFSKETSIVTDSSLYMGAVAAADLWDNGEMQFLWSGRTKTLAYSEWSLNSSVDLHPKQKVSIYPNPTEGEIMLDAGFDQLFDIQVYTETGQIIFQKKNVRTNKAIPLHSLPSGIYFITFSNENSQTHKRLIVH